LQPSASQTGDITEKFEGNVNQFSSSKIPLDDKVTGTTKEISIKANNEAIFPEQRNKQPIKYIESNKEFNRTENHKNEGNQRIVEDSKKPLAKPIRTKSVSIASKTVVNPKSASISLESPTIAALTSPPIPINPSSNITSSPVKVNESTSMATTTATTMKAKAPPPVIKRVKLVKDDTAEYVVSISLSFFFQFIFFSFFYIDLSHNSDL